MEEALRDLISRGDATNEMDNLATVLRVAAVVATEASKLHSKNIQ